jgi:uncharacterized protein
MITNELLAEIREQFRINWDGIHGITHWARVYDIGMRLAEQIGANKNVVQLFSVFHDSRRHNENLDPKHGARGAELATQLRDRHFPLLSAADFELLHQACCLHTKASTHSNVTVQTCFDADRLDLGRVGIVPKAKYLCTNFARSKEMISWAHQRSVDGYVPDNLLGGFAL